MKQICDYSVRTGSNSSSIIATLSGVARMFRRLAVMTSIIAICPALPLLASEPGLSFTETSKMHRLEHQSTDFQDIKQITFKILLKEIELERFNIDYRKHANVQGRWRGPRYYLSQAGNNASTMAGLFDAVAIREDDRPSRIALENSFVPQMVGQLVAASGSATELAVNKFHDRQAKKLGLDSKAALKKARRFKADIDALLEERARLIADGAGRISQQDLALLAAEEKVLFSLTRLSLHEFVQFYAGTRRFRWFQDSLYVMDIAKNLVGATGNIVAIEGLKRGQPTFVGHAGVLVLTSGALIAANPVLSRGVGKMAGALSRRQCRDLLLDDCEQVKASLDNDLEVFSRQLKQAQGETELAQELADILAVHREQCNMIRLKSRQAERELRKGTRSATENVLAGLVVGSTKVTLGICALVAGYHHYDSPRRSNQLLQDGSLVYGIGNAIGLAESTRIQLRNEFERHKFKRERRLPGQIYEDNLETLDRIEQSLTGEVLKK